MSLSWKPVRKGPSFCSPACGSGCTHDEYLEAWKLGKSALSKLKNKKNWKVRVWENAGWHVCLSKGGRFTIHIRKYGDSIEYTCLYTTSPIGVGSGEPQYTVCGDFSNINEAVQAQERKVKKVFNRLRKTILTDFPDVSK